MFCERCGEKFNLNILTGECFNCGVDKYNDPVVSRRIQDIKLTPDLVIRGKVNQGETEVYVLDRNGTTIARGWK